MTRKLITHCFFYNDRRFWINYDDAPITFEKLQEEITKQAKLEVNLQQILKGAVTLTKDNFTSDNNDDNESAYEVSILPQKK